MDSFTQIALGACIGQAIGYRKFGIKALVFGGLGGLIPDLDVITTPSD
jgi:inner membrane protein